MNNLIGCLMIFIVGFCSFEGNAQNWKFVKSVTSLGVELAAIDNRGNIYIVNRRGDVVKYSQEGKLLLEFSPVQQSRIKEINTTSQLKVHLFYEELQEYVLLNRYLSSPVTYKIRNFDLGYVEDIAPNFDQSVWLVDVSDFSLKLIDTRTNSLKENKSLAKILDQKESEIIAFHSYQNRLYLIDKTAGVLVFDNIGNFLYKFDEISPSKVGFDQDFMYFKKGSSLSFRHLYNGESRELILPEREYEQIAYQGGLLIGFSKEGFDIYKYLSGK